MRLAQSPHGSPPRRLQHTGCSLGKPHFENHKPHFRILAKPCNLSQVKATCGQWLRTIEVDPQVEPSHDSRASISALYSFHSRQRHGVDSLADPCAPAAGRAGCTLVCSSSRRTSDGSRCGTLSQLFVELHLHRARYAGRLGSASDFRFQGPLSFRKKPDVFGHCEHPGWRGPLFSVGDFRLDGGWNCVGIPYFRCLLRRTSIEAKVWCFVRALLFGGLAVGAKLARTIAMNTHWHRTRRLVEDEHDDEDDFSGAFSRLKSK